MDVVFLAYANSKDHPLPALVEEEEQVYSTLVNKALGGDFFIHRERYATPQKVNEYLGKFSDRLAIFLYSGHAGGNSVLLDDKDANAAGIALQLTQSIANGVLKLVVLNGCSTAGQVAQLLDIGVPAVVATHAPVNDSSAKEFAVRFFQGMSEGRLTIAQAFEEALGPAQLVTKQDLTGKKTRDIGFAKTLDATAPLWELFYASDGAVDINPLPLKTYGKNSDYDPNEILIPALYDSLYHHGSPRIKLLKELEATEYVPLEIKLPAILANFPFPVAAHLQKLLMPIEEEDLGCDKANLERLDQVGRLFQSTMELMGVIMIAQMWELKLRNKDLQVPEDLRQVLRHYFYLSATDRAIFDYLPFIRAIREYFDTLEAVEYFIKELKDLKESAVPGQPFEKACRDLYALRKQTVRKAIPQDEVEAICLESEKTLCIFFEAVGFFFRYSLTSIQGIDTLKYRHEQSVQYKHRIFQLMQGGKSKELLYYLLPNYLDSMGILVIKQDVQWVRKKSVFTTGQPFEFLNLSPFLIDRTAFEGGDMSNLMFFSQFYPQTTAYEFKNVSKPDSKKDALKIGEQEAFEALRQQLQAFRVMLLNEPQND